MHRQVAFTPWAHFTSSTLISSTDTDAERPRPLSPHLPPAFCPGGTRPMADGISRAGPGSQRPNEQGSRSLTTGIEIRPPLIAHPAFKRFPSITISSIGPNVQPPLSPPPSRTAGAVSAFRLSTFRRPRSHPPPLLSLHQGIMLSVYGAQISPRFLLPLRSPFTPSFNDPPTPVTLLGRKSSATSHSEQSAVFCFTGIACVFYFVFVLPAPCPCREQKPSDLPSIKNGYGFQKSL